MPTVILSGGPSTDIIVGQDDDDYIAGAAGDDTLDGGSGNDTIYGGAGADVLTGGLGVDVFVYGAGDSGTLLDRVDVITDWSFADKLAIAGVGANPINVGVFYNVASFAQGLEFANALFGSSTDQVVTVLYSGYLAVFYNADPGDGTTDGAILLPGRGPTDLSSSNFVLMPGLPPNAPAGTPAPPPSIQVDHQPVGTSGADTMVGTAFVEEIRAAQGNDSVSAGGGPDALYGEDGNDTLAGGDGDDRIWGAGGNDLIDGGAGNDLVNYYNATSGVHVSLGVTSPQSIGGGEGVDRISNVERVYGSPNADWLGGGVGDDFFMSWGGDDSVVGGAGNDTLNGMEGDDYLAGGDGDDLVIGGPGRDLITGGAGADLIQVADIPTTNGAGVTEAQIDVVLDWSRQDELIFGSMPAGGYSETVASTYAGALAAAGQLMSQGAVDFVSVQVGPDVYVFADSHFDNGQADDAIRLTNVSLADISAANIRAYDYSTTGQATPRASGQPTALPPGFGSGDLSATITLPNLAAYAYDAAHGSVFMSSTTGALVRYDLVNGIMGSPVQIGGSLKSLAVSQDGQYLLAADNNRVVTSGPSDFVTTYADTVYRVWLGSGAVDQLRFAVSSPETGIYDVAIASNGVAMIITGDAGSTEFRTFVGNAPTLQVSDMAGLGSVRGLSYLKTSEDGSLVMIQEAGVSSGPVHLYDASMGQIRSATNLNSNGLGGDFNGGGGDVSGAAGGLLIDQVGSGTYVFDQDMRLVANLTGVYGAGSAIAGAQFSEAGQQLFIWNSTQHKVLVVDTVDWTQVGSLDVAAAPMGGNLAAYSGAMDLIAGGRVLLLATGQGLQLIDLAANLHLGLTGDATSQTLRGAIGADTLSGDGGADTLMGRGGADSMSGGTGDDSLDGGEGDNVLRGNEGDDQIVGGSGFDNINGNQGRDLAHGGTGGDWVLGGQDDDELWGDEGDDIVNGNLGSDRVHGGAGADAVRGGQGSDVLWGDAGADTLWGDRGDDFLYGGAGADVFNISPEAGLDWVYDFSAAEGDRVAVPVGAQYVVYQYGADTVIDVTAAGSGGRMILTNTQLATLPTGWIFQV